MPIKIIPTTTAAHLAKKFPKNSVVWPKGNRDGKFIFPDGEVYAALPDLDKNTRYVVLHSGMPRPNEGLMELKIILEILKNNSIPNIEVCFSYFPYGMQDNVFDPGEINVAESLIKEFCEYYPVKKIFVLDAHFAGKDWVKKYPLENIPVFEWLKKDVTKSHPDIIFLAPDCGGQQRTGLTGLNKKRVNSHAVEVEHSANLKKVVQNRVVGVVDDIIETGSTLERFSEECQKCGAKASVAIITHGVLEKGIKRIKKSYQKIFLTNSINRKEANVDIAPLLIKHLHI